MQYILAHDLGTSGNKATLFSTEGKLISSAVEPYPCHYYNGNRAEQDPEDWYAAVCRATKRLTGLINPVDIVGISFSGHMMGAVLLDAAGQLLRPAIIWADQRATEQVAKLSETVGDDRFYAISGNRNNPTNSICKIMWAMEHDGLADRIGKAVNCKDYLIYRLTEQLGTDYSDASGTGLFDFNSFSWSQEIAAGAGIPMEILPELHAATDMAGRITAQAARDTGLTAGTPVFCGVGDGTAAAVGTGIGTVGQAYLSLGTSAWISYLDDSPCLDEQQRTFNLAGIEKGRVYPVGSMQAAGSSYSWMRDQLCRAEKTDAERLGTDIYRQINDQIAKTPVGSNGVLYLPYLMGERSPWWDASIQGSFLGLKQETTHADLLRAVMEGVSLNMNLIMRVFRGKRSFESLRIIGGAAKDPIWRQMLADVLNVRLEKLNLLEEGCSLGAAVTAGIGAGVYRDASAIGKFLQVDDICEPNPERAAQYAILTDRLEEAYRRLKGFYE